VSDPRGRPDRVHCRRRRPAWLPLVVLGPLVLATAAVSGQPPGGALAGNLTDIHSRPLDGVTLTLRNALTGTETRTVTGKGGAYRFSDLPPGEYALEAVSPQLGKGAVGGIYVSAGHESKVLAAIALTRDAEASTPASTAAIPLPSKPLVPNLARLRSGSAESPRPASATVAGGVELEILASLPLADHAILAVQRRDRPAVPASAPGTGDTKEASSPVMIARVVESGIAPAEPGAPGTPSVMVELTVIGPGALTALVAISAAQMALAAPS